MPIVEKCVRHRRTASCIATLPRVIGNVKKGPDKLRVIIIIVSSCVCVCVGERQELETLWCASLFLPKRQSLPSFLSVLSPSLLYLFFTPALLAHNAMKIRMHGTNSWWIEISSRGYLSIESVFRPRHFAIVRNIRGCYSQVRAGAPTWKWFFLTLRVANRQTVQVTRQIMRNSMKIIGLSCVCFLMKFFIKNVCFLDFFL